MPLEARWTTSPSISAASTGSRSKARASSGKFAGPVEPVAGDQSDLAFLDAGEQAIAVVFDLVQPVRARRCRAGECCELRLQIDRHRPLAPTGNTRERTRPVAFDFTLSGIPHPVAVVGDRFERAAGLDTERIVHNDGVAALRHSRVVALFDQKPIRAPFAGGFAAHPHQCPVAVQLLAAQFEFQRALGMGCCRVGIGRDPYAAVPQQHGAAAILPFGDDALEPAIIDRVVLDLDSEPLLTGVEARTLRHRPALQYAVELETKVEMQPARVVLLDDESERRRRFPARRRLARRLRRFPEIALAPVLFERHAEGLFRRDGSRLWLRVELAQAR